MSPSTTVYVFSSMICFAVVHTKIFAEERAQDGARTVPRDVFDGLLPEAESLPKRETDKWVSFITKQVRYTSMRKKRSLTAIGALALRALLREAKPVRSKSKKYRNFEKKGDFVTALRDFLSVNPVGISERTTEHGTKIIQGHVGDRLLVLRNRSFLQQPSLEIVDKTSKRLEPREQFVDRIIYSKTQTKTH